MFSVPDLFDFVHIETVTSPRISPKKKIWYRPNEVQALLKATERHRNAGDFEPDGLWQTIKGSKACQTLKLTEKYTKYQLCSKVKRMAKTKEQL